MSLLDELKKISGEIKKQRNLIKKESAIKQVSVQPFIKALGYNTNNLAEVEEEFDADAADSGGERVDYAIKFAGEPVILIEAKQASAILSEKFWKQLHHYVGATDARFGVLTNGIEYRFYTDLKKSNVMDKMPFLVIDMLSLDERLVTELEGFTKTGFDPERVVAGARKRVLARLLKQEMNNPSDEIARLFAKQLTTKRLTSDELSYYAGLLREAWQDLTKSPDRPPPPNGDCEDKSDPDFIPVYGNYEGHRLEAALKRESIIKGLTIGGHCIRYEGRLMNTTWAARAAIRSINPSFKYKRGNPNGFQFWHVVDPADGKEHMIREISGWERITDEALRQRVLNKS